MRPLPVSLGLGILLFATLGCTAPAEDEAALAAEREAQEQADREAINALVGDYVTHYNANDSKGLTSLFSEDAVRMPPEDKPFEGHTRIESEYDAEFEAGTGEITIVLDETVLADTLAFVRGTWADTSTPEGGDATTIVGKWLNLIELQDDGSWKIARNMWNLDTPNGL